MAFAQQLHGSTRLFMAVRGVLGLLVGVAAGLVGSTALAAESPVVPKLEFEAMVHPVKPMKRPEPPVRSDAAIPASELPTGAIANNGFATQSAFAASSVPSPNSSTLSPPVVLTYSGGSPVLQVNDSGTNRGIESLITNSHNSNSALFGQTNGSGAGLAGFNSGTGGPAGKFSITNSSSGQAAVTATTNGTGAALLATVQVGHGQAAILGENTTLDDAGTAVEGMGGAYGVQGFGVYAGVYGSGQSYGVYGYSAHGSGATGQSDDGNGMYGYSTSGIGTYAASDTGTGVSAYSDSYRSIYADTYSGTAVVAHSYSGYGISSVSDTGNGIIGQSTNNHGVVGEDFGSGDGIYGYSSTGYAGYFAGKVGATSYVTLSDRNAKTKIHAIDGKAVLDKVNALPVSSWVFKSDPQKTHVGPMAQDFHAAFGLDGDDDTHINLTDIAGVSLAAIKELSKEIKERDAQIQVDNAEVADLKQQLATQTRALAQIKSVLETVTVRMTALEQQHRLGVTQTVGLRKEPGTMVQ